MTPTFAPLDIVVLLWLIVASPLIGRWFFQRLKQWTDAGLPQARVKSYNQIYVMEWVSTIALVFWWFAIERTAAAMGWSYAPSGWQWLGWGLGLAAIIGLVIQERVVVNKTEELAKLRDAMGDLEAIVPHNDREARMFMGVSVTAGVCEEILYRGMLLAILAPTLGTWGAVVAGAVVFGLGHLYQGPKGVVKTGAVGLVMGALTVLSGSIIPAMIVHTGIDMSSGRMMKKALEASSE